MRQAAKNDPTGVKFGAKPIEFEKRKAGILVSLTAGLLWS
jgi:hypothetical protein